jgi:hypothetical protein
MIVIVTHDNIDILNTFLNSLKNVDLNNHEVSIIDTNSQSQNFIDYFFNLKNTLPYNFYKLDYKCYDSGGYIWAYQNLKSDNWIFLQDSIEIIRPDFIKKIDNKLEQYEVVGGFDFPYSYDPNELQKPWVETDIEFEDYPELGIFGPMFSVRNTTMDRIPKHWLKYPPNKLMQQGMERRWSLIFHSINATKTYLEGYGNIHSSKWIKKHFYIRP